MNKKTWMVRRDPFASRSFFPVLSGGDLKQPEDWRRLLPAAGEDDPTAGIALNTAFPDVERRAAAFLQTLRKPRLRLTLVGLGDVGGTLLTALKLLGGELNQILDRPEPRVIVRSEAELFDCDAFLFTASRGVPPIGAAGDVRMLQFEKNREMLKAYSALARKTGFTGLFCQISDPVDQLSRCVFLQTNRNEAGEYDFRGLLQIVGFGLGVMRARAGDMAGRLGVDGAELRAYGPHGAGLVVANAPLDYDEAISALLTRQTVSANLELRELGFKPYIAPAISSAALSILGLLRGEPFLGAVPMGGVYFGCRSRLTELGFAVISEPLHPALQSRIRAAWERLKEAEPLCRA